MFKNQGTSQPKASQYVNGDRHDMASEWEELVELDDVQLATVVGGLLVEIGIGFGGLRLYRDEETGQDRLLAPGRVVNGVLVN